MCNLIICLVPHVAPENRGSTRGYYPIVLHMVNVYGYGQIPREVA